MSQIKEARRTLWREIGILVQTATPEARNSQEFIVLREIDALITACLSQGRSEQPHWGIDTDALRSAVQFFDEHANGDERQKAIHRISLVQAINLIDLAQQGRSEQRIQMANPNFWTQELYEEVDRRVLAALARWQPIETAPKDRRILVLTDKEAVYIARWVSPAGFAHFEERDGWQVFDCEDGFYSFALGPEEVTHWMPLPEAQQEIRRLTGKKNDDLGAQGATADVTAGNVEEGQLSHDGSAIDYLKTGCAYCDGYGAIFDTDGEERTCPHCDRA